MNKIIPLVDLVVTEEDEIKEFLSTALELRLIGYTDTLDYKKVGDNAFIDSLYSLWKKAKES